MATFWTFSGINSYSSTAGRIVDYVWEDLRGRVSKSPKRRYASRLGTGSYYKGSNNVLNLKSGKILDDEAREFTAGRIHHDKIPRGMLKGKQVRCLLVAPKTTTKPPKANGLVIELYWNPMDGVPNQAAFKLDSKNTWKKYPRGGGKFWAVSNRLGSGFSKGHDFAGFMVASPRIMNRIRVQRPGGGARGKYSWVTSPENRAPSPVKRIQGWLDDPLVDYVFVAHSQGTNIALHVLEQGFK